MDAPVASSEVECYLRRLEEALLEQVTDSKRVVPFDATTEDIRRTLKSLKSDSRMVIPTDKTNSFAFIALSDYKKEVRRHLERTAKEIDRTTVVSISEQGYDLLKKNRDMLSKKEYSFLRESLKLKGIPKPKLLIKDHKPVDPTTGTHPTRLIVPADNFAAGFAKAGRDGLMAIFKDLKLADSP
jgi:hypothetical protein